MLSWHTTDINSINERKLSFLIRCWPHNTMWYHFALLLLAGAAAVVSENIEFSHIGAWMTDTEYEYHVQSQTMAVVGMPPQMSGITMKGVFNIQVQSKDKLIAQLVKMRYAQVQTQVKDGWESADIPEDTITFRDIPMLGKIFEIKIKHGVIRDIKVDKKTPSWEVNMIKSFVSQMQIDTQGENAKKDNSTQIPTDNSPYAMFKVMEDTVGGKCEVYYDILPMFMPEIPMSVQWSKKKIQNINEDSFIEIRKTKNYNKCEQRPTYFAGHIDRVTKKSRPFDDKNKFVTESATSNSIIMGDLKHYTIQSSIMTNQIFLNPRIADDQSGSVLSKVNVTLMATNYIDKIMMPSDDLESMGNLVYDCDEMISNKWRKPRRSSQISTEDQSDSNESSKKDSSSEENVSFESPFEKATNCPMMAPPLIDMDVNIPENVNPVQMITDVIDEIVNDMEDPNQMPQRETTDKFTILVSLIRKMDFMQLKEIEESKKMFSMERMKKKNKNIQWKIFRDAVVQAGTESTLKIIKGWIVKKMIDDVEASWVFSRLPRTVYAPREQYIDEFFEIIQMPEVKKQKFMSKVAPLAFAEMVRYSFFDIRKPFIITVPEEKKIVEIYIPYMAGELKKAVKDGDSPQIQTYIWAIGKFAHPKILSVFEPYLEGKVSISNFQRWWMVCSLEKLIATMPEKVQFVLYKIYLNKHEVQEIRSTAVYLLMMTKPSLFMMIRMASFSNFELNDHVASAVKSAIQGAAKLKRPEWQVLAKNANIVKKLLTSKDFDFSVSYLNIIDDLIEKRNFAYTIMMKVIGSDNTFIPKMMHSTMYYTVNGYHPPNIETGYLVSDFKKIMEKMKEIPSMKSEVEKIARILDIQPDEPEQMEGNIFFSNMYGLWFLPFDNHTIDVVADKMTEIMGQPTWNGGEKVFSKMISTDVMIGMPTETGMMFTYNMKSPIIGKFKIKSTAHFAKKNNATALKVDSDMDIVMFQKLQGKFGFFVPFENQQYIAGIDQKVQVYIPFVANFEVKPYEMQSFDMHIRPNVKTPKIRMIHFSVVPFTAKRDVFDIKPVTICKGKMDMRINKPNKVMTSFAGDIIIIKAETDNPRFSVDWSDVYKMPENFVKLWSTYSPHYRSFDVYFNQEKVPWARFMASYEAKSTMLPDVDIEQSSLLKLKSIVSKIDDEWSDESIKEVYESEISKGLDSDHVHVIDLRAAIPDKNVSLLINMVKNKLDDKMRFLARTSALWKISKEPSTKHEFCFSGDARFTPVVPFDLHRALEEKQEDKINVEIMYGDKCRDGKEISMYASLKRSEEMIKKMMNSELVKKCQSEMKKDNMLTLDCQKVNKLVHMRDQMKISFNNIKEEEHMIRNAVKQLSDIVPQIKVTYPRDPDRSSIDVELNLLPHLNKAEFVETPTMNFNSLLDNSLTKQLSPSNVKLDILTSSLSNLMMKPRVMCNVDSNQIITFDGKIVPFKFGKCWHVIMTTYPKENPDKFHQMMPIPKEQQVAVMMRDEDNDKRKMKMIIGNKKIVAERPGDNWEVMVDGKPISVSPDKVYQEISDGKIIFDIVVTVDDNIGIIARKQEVEVVFDGKRLQIKIPIKYGNSVRGTCGKYDKWPGNDFTVPKNCVVRNPEEFIASYAITDEDCEGLAMENKRKAENAKCVFISHKMSNVISDKEAGRFSTEEWGYHPTKETKKKHCNSHRTRYFEKDDEICFSIIPMPSCTEDCWATEVKMMKNKVHCMPINSEEAKQMKSRIDKGANPDMRHKTVSKMHNFEIAVACA